MTKSLRYKPWVLGVALLAAACGSESESEADPPTDQDYDDIAQSVAPLIRAEVTTSGGAYLSAQVAMGDAPGWLAAEANGSVQGSAGSLHWTFSANCHDVHDAPIAVCDSTTDSAAVALSVTGQLTLPNYSAQLAAEGNWSLDGLQGNTLVATGQSSVDASTLFKGFVRPSTRSFDLQFDASYNLSMPPADPDRVSGQAHATIDAKRRVTGTNNDHDVHFVVDAQVTLDGSGHAIIVLDGNAAFELNLASGEVVRVNATMDG